MNGGIWGAAAGLAIFLFFPVFLTANVFADVKARKGYFSFYLMRFIKIYGGYATLYDRGIAFHLTGRKARPLPFLEIVLKHRIDALHIGVPAAFYLIHLYPP